jgi:ATP-dependent DNA ligase
MELEGIVSKKLNSRYRSGRQTTWLKAKCFDEGDFVVIGAEHEPGKPAFALLARESEDGLEYAAAPFSPSAAMSGIGSGMPSNGWDGPRRRSQWIKARAVAGSSLSFASTSSI